MLGSPITTSHPIDSDIRLVKIEPGFYSANERLLSTRASPVKLGPVSTPVTHRCFPTSGSTGSSAAR